ncbi:MAG: DUF1622 domain-containing protein [Lentisphaerae bacterium]|nr:DUF1622 domain-containing protein [Lentisphaerota bacterium]
MRILEYLSLGIAIVGVAVIVWGALLCLLMLVRLEMMQARGKNICRPRELMRHHFGSYILLGLEFLIAADVVHTINKPTLHELALLGSIVAIRTVLSFFLNREFGSHSCRDNSVSP